MAAGVGAYAPTPNSISYCFMANPAKAGGAKLKGLTSHKLTASCFEAKATAVAHSNVYGGRALALGVRLFCLNRLLWLCRVRDINQNIFHPAVQNFTQGIQRFGGNRLSVLHAVKRMGLHALFIDQVVFRHSSVQKSPVKWFVAYHNGITRIKVSYLTY